MGVLDGKGALVTGGSRGIGRAIVKRLAADGAAVVFSFVQVSCGQPDDIARVVAFLAGPDSGWMTGQVLRADGGLQP
jgi:3-oxoacyl-[acyl-carrier protein] reductase